MEFLNGKVLKDYVAGNPLPLGTVLNVGIELADGLSASHARGIVHRDIKPANVFVTDSGHAKILNFGLAQLAAKSQMDDTGTMTDAIADLSGDQLTLPWTTNATVAYMSPERVRGEELDARTDLFSLGLVLYEMATGERPFRGTTPGVVTDAILHYAPTPVRQVIPKAPAQLEQIVGKALEKDRNLRYQKASDIRADLETLMNRTH
jgi:serine/threonine protein kinase